VVNEKAKYKPVHNQLHNMGRDYDFPVRLPLGPGGSKFDTPGDSVETRFLKHFFERNFI